MDKLNHFDKQHEKDPYAMATYAKDIFDYYKHREGLFVVENYFPRHPSLSVKKRARLIDWMVELQETFETNHETLYLAVKLLDLYLSRVGHKVEGTSLTLIASTAVFIASKYDERFAPLIADFIYMASDGFSRTQLITMERELFRVVGFDLGAPVSYRFLRRFARVTKMGMPTLTLARYILETSLMFFEFNRLPGSLVASGAYLLAARMKGEADWTTAMEYHSGYTLEEVEPMMWGLNSMMVARENVYSNFTNIFNKYSHEVFYKVASILPLPVQESPSSMSVASLFSLDMDIHRVADYEYA